MVGNHFDYYCAENDLTCLEDLELRLEENFERLMFDFGITNIERIPIFIYPDISSFHKAINIQDGPDWLVGYCKNNQIKMVSPLNPGKYHWLR